MLATDDSATAFAPVIRLGVLADLTEAGDAHTSEYAVQTFEDLVRTERSLANAAPRGYSRRTPTHSGVGLTWVAAQHSRVYTVVLGWLAALFAVMAAMLTLAAAVVGWPVLLLAAPLAGVAYLFWYHASGRLTERLREQARHGPTAARGNRQRRRAATAAGTGSRRNRSRWAGEPRAGARWAGDPRSGRGPTGRQRSPPQADSGMSPNRARGVLGVGSGADSEAVRTAYREKVKETHPDRGGSTEAFQRVTEAYETLDETSA